MKFIILSIFVVVLALFDISHSNPTHEKMEKECLTLTGYNGNHEKIEQLLHMKTPATTQPEKCFVKCVAEKMFVVEASGKINATTLKAPKVPEFFEKSKLTEAVITECGGKTGANPCDIAYEVGKCLVMKAGHHKA